MLKTPKPGLESGAPIAYHREVSFQARRLAHVEKRQERREEHHRF